MRDSVSQVLKDEEFSLPLQPSIQGRKKMFSSGGADVCVLIRALARGKIFS